MMLAPPQRSASRIQSRWKRSPRRLQTCSRRSGRCTQIRVSSEKRTDLHLAKVHLRWVLAHRSRLSLFASSRIGPRYGTRARSPLSRKRRQMVYTETSLPCVPIVCRAVSTAVLNLSRIWLRWMMRSWRLFVTLGRPERGRSRVEPVSTTRRRSRRIVVTWQPIRLATSWGRSP